MTGYTKTGPFTNGSAPGISAAFLNAMEQWLAYAADSAITTDGNGNLTCVSVTTSASVNISGGLGVVGVSQLDGGYIVTNGTGTMTIPNITVTGHVVQANNAAYRAKDSGGTAHDILYVDTANEVNLQMANSSVKLFIRDASGNALFSIDNSGNVRCKGTLTQSVTP